MAKLGKFLGLAAVVGAVAGGIAYFKKKESCMSCDTDDDFDDEKIFNVDTDFSDEDRKYVSITINSKKAKDTMSDAKDAIGDFASKAKEKVVDMVGEEKVESVKESVSDFAGDAKDWAKDSVKKAMSYASEAKDKIKDTVVRRTEDSYEVDEDDAAGEDVTSDDVTSDNAATEENAATDETAAEAETADETAAAEESDEFLTEELDDEING